MKEAGLFKRFAWLVFGAGPVIVLALSVVLAAVATIVLDHDVLGRDAEGWPVLYKTPLLRHAVAAFHLAIVYVLPPLLAVLFLVLGQRMGANRAWVLIGGVLVCAIGSVHVIAALWTGVKGTSDLKISLVEDELTIAVRLAVNLAAYGAALVYFGRRRGT